MNHPVVDDQLWKLVKPLLLPLRPRQSRYLGRRQVSTRAALNGILLVLSTGMQWSDLPHELGYGSGAYCARRLRCWQQAGVWDQVYKLTLAALQQNSQSEQSHLIGERF